MENNEQDKRAEANQKMNQASKGSRFDEHKGMVTHEGFPYFIADKNDEGSVEEDVRNHR